MVYLKQFCCKNVFIEKYMVPKKPVDKHISIGTFGFEAMTLVAAMLYGVMTLQSTPPRSRAAFQAT